MVEERICERCGTKDSEENPLMAFKPSSAEETIHLCHKCRETIRGEMPDVVIEIDMIAEWVKRRDQKNF